MSVSMRTARGRRRRRWLLALVIGLCLAAVPHSAQAHPFGAPLTATISQDETTGTVEVVWAPGSPDDITYLAAGLGLDSMSHATVDDALIYVKDDTEKLASSAQLPPYLLKHITVTGGQQPCTASIVSVDHLVANGARLSFDCGPGITRATVRISMLTDLHPAYQTMATGPGGQRFVYTSGQAAHDWSLGAAAGDAGLGRSAAVQLSAVLGSVVVIGLLAGGAVVLVRRRRRPAGQTSEHLSEGTPTA
jgi:hypothetical protein